MSVSRHYIGQYIPQYAFVVFIFKSQPTVARINYIIFLKGYPQRRGCAIFPSSKPKKIGVLLAGSLILNFKLYAHAFKRSH